jgi:site-specific DNA-methyltransferase (adenine-specific)
MLELLNKIICGDCIEVLNKVQEPFADLIFADPPFNIGYKYDKYHDKKDHRDYVGWTRQWMSACKKVLKPHGSFYIAIGDDYAANVKLIATDELGLFMRNWIIWHYTFGQQTKNKFARAHTHIFYFVNDRKNFTFNTDVTSVLSDRQKKYQDKRANPDGKMPDDVWDEYPRVCGTFEERVDFPCQMPEGLLARIIRVSSNPGDWVLDPFSGSGTTAVIAAKLNRRYTGIEISEEYARKTEERLRDPSGDALRHCVSRAVKNKGKAKWTEHLEAELKWLYHENKVPAAKLSNDPALLTLFTDKFNKRIGTDKNLFQPTQVIRHLIQMVKKAKLGPLRGYSTEGPSEQYDATSTLWGRR